MKDGAEGMVSEKDISEGGTGYAADICLLMDTEQIRVGTFDGEAAGVVMDIIDHAPQLTVAM